MQLVRQPVGNFIQKVLVDCFHEAQHYMTSVPMGSPQGKRDEG